MDRANCTCGARGPLQSVQGLREFVENGTEVGSIAAIGGTASSDLVGANHDRPLGVARRDLVDKATAIGAAVVGLGVGVVGVGMFADFEGS